MIKHDRARLEAFRQHWDALKDAWRSYTGQEYAVGPYYEPILQDEMATDAEYIAKLRARQRSALLNAYATCQRAYALCCTEVGRRRQRVVNAVMTRREQT